eukprot:scaffold35212_cov69-Phaeocystis_antarctica.AAC.12
MGRQQRRVEPDALVVIDWRTMLMGAVDAAKAASLVATSTRRRPCLDPARQLLITHGVGVEVGHLRGRRYEVLKELERAPQTLLKEIGSNVRSQLAIRAGLLVVQMVEAGPTEVDKCRALQLGVQIRRSPKHLYHSHRR